MAVHMLSTCSQHVHTPHHAHANNTLHYSVDVLVCVECLHTQPTCLCVWNVCVWFRVKRVTAHLDHTDPRTHRLLPVPTLYSSKKYPHRVCLPSTVVRSPFFCVTISNTQHADRGAVPAMADHAKKCKGSKTKKRGGFNAGEGWRTVASAFLSSTLHPHDHPHWNPWHPLTSIDLFRSSPFTGLNILLRLFFFAFFCAFFCSYMA